MRTSNRRLVPALAALVFAWAMIPSALAQCGIPTKLTKPVGGIHKWVERMSCERLAMKRKRVHRSWECGT